MVQHQKHHKTQKSATQKLSSSLSLLHCHRFKLFECNSRQLFLLQNWVKRLLTPVSIYCIRVFSHRNPSYSFRLKSTSFNPLFHTLSQSIWSSEHRLFFCDFFASFLLLMIYHLITTFPLSTTRFQGPYPKISTDFWRRVHLRASIKGWRIKIGGGKLWEWGV